jgi:hypothetical protein
MSERTEIIWKEIFNQCKEENVWIFNLSILFIDHNWYWHDICLNGKKIETTEQYINRDDLRELSEAGLIKYLEGLTVIKPYNSEEYYYEVLKKDF